MSNGSQLVYTILKYDFLDTLGSMLNNKTFITMPPLTFTNSEKNLRVYISRFNKLKGTPPNGGLLKTRVSRRIFTGMSIGTLYLQEDDRIKDAKVSNGLNLKLYGLYPLLGINRNVFAKFGVNYTTYSNETYKKSITAGTFGLRYSAISGHIRPYMEGSVGAALSNVNNRPDRIGFPVILEGGINIPVKTFFITVGVSLTPILSPSLNGYKFAAFNVGVLF